MINKIIKITSIIFQPKMFIRLISMYTIGYLNEIGWINSFKKQMPIDKNSNPLLWVTYGFIDFISERLNKSIDVFEYGSGNSTLWYATQVNSVTSVEHDRKWLEKIKNSMPENADMYYQELEYGEAYSQYPNKLNKKFNIVIVDGRDRVNCIKNAINSIKDDGIIVLDDSERETYEDGISFLLNKNFKKIDFWGISPGSFHKKNTTIFYRENNCLGI